MEIIKKKITTLTIFMLSIITVLSFFKSGFFNIHDDAQVQRVHEMKIALSDGMFPVRWVPDLGYGYGYPIFNFYGPFPYYIGAFFNFIGFDALTATKIMILIAVIGSAFSMYLLAKEFWGKIGGIVSSAFYVYAPYHALDIYVRGDIGEVYAYAFIPLVFYALWKFYKTNNFLFIVLGSLSYAGIISSHNLSALMISPFVILTSLVLLGLRKKILILLIPVLGILLASFYFLPTLLEMNYTNVLSTIGGKAHFGDHFVCVRQFWDSPWMFGGSIPGCIDGLSFRLGKLHILFAGVALLSGIYLFKKEKNKSSVIFVSLAALGGVMFLMISASSLIWEKVPYMNFFQYPWRFLLAASFFSSFIAGSFVYAISKINLRKYNLLFLIIYVAIIISPIILYSKLFVPQNYLSKSSGEYTNKHSLNWTTSNISDEYMPKSFMTPETPSEIIKEKITGENIRISNLETKTNRILAKINSNTENEITVHIPYFPSWKYYIDGNRQDIKEVETGILIKVPRGESELVGKFEETYIQKVANLLTISGVLILFAGIIYAKRKQK